MEEKNKKSLKKAIDNLPKYSPSENLWDKLSDNLEQTQADQVLHEAIESLPTYTAPEAAWSNIVKELPVVRKRIWPKVLAMAATLALLIGCFMINNANNFGDPIVSVSHQEKQVPSGKFVQMTNINHAQRDSAFKTIVSAQKESNERGKEILAELEELNSSKLLLKSKLSQFDVNENLEQKLNQIEAESMELQQAYLGTI